MHAEQSGFEIEVKTLHLAEPFRIAHGATSEREVVRIRSGEAIGEGPLVPYYGDRAAPACAWLETHAPPAIAACLETQSEPELPDGPRAARMALSVLCADLAGQQRGLPLWKMWGVSAGPHAPSVRSVGIPDDLDAFRVRIRKIACQFPVIKLKLGSGDLEFDEAIAAAARDAAPDVRMFADANCGWSVADAARIIPRLADAGIEFIEQPVGRDSLDPWRELRRLLPDCPLPLFADESAQSPDDVPRLTGLVDGINVKVVKCGGLDRAREMIARARTHDLRVMLGCMIESSLGITAAAHLAGLADLADLDGHLYLSDDDFAGATYDPHGRLRLPDRPGLGCRER